MKTEDLDRITEGFGGLRILVLGHMGMLGHMVLKYLKSKNILIETIDFRWPSTDFKNYIKKFEGDFIVNCIGSIPQRTQSFDLNWEIPIFLDLYGRCKIIHPGTDCEMDEDLYGTSKKIARDFIVNTSRQTKSIKTSIIGPELNGNSSLLEWFLSNPDGSEVHGYSRFYWNGNTTLTWSKICLDLILNWENYGRETIISSPCIPKKEILDSINEIYNRKIVVLEKNNIEKNKCLVGDIYTEHIKNQLLDLKKFYNQ